MKSRLINTVGAALVVAVVLMAATVLYLARQVMSLPDEMRVGALIEERLAQQRESAPPAAKASGLTQEEIGALIDKRMDQRQGGGRSVPPAAKPSGPTEKEIMNLIDKRLDQRKSAGLPEEEFNARVEKGIVAFIEKQRRAEQERPSQLARNVPQPGKDDHIYGKPNAPVTLIEYSDFECPFCKRFHATAKQLVDNSNGQVNWVYRHFPIESHNPGAQKQAEAAECAAAFGGNEAFWKYTDTIYERTRSGGKGFPIERLTPLAAELGLDREAFRQCLDSGRMAARVRRDYESGTKAGVNGTPGNILLNNRTGQVIAMPGARPYEQLKAAVDQLLKAK